MSLSFQKNKEDFVCEKCGFAVTGNGYTNHCPKCLWSKHVDVNPGDRAEECGGLMKPVTVVMEKGKFVITHQCQKCGYEKRNKVADEDDLSVLLDKH